MVGVLCLVAGVAGGIAVGHFVLPPREKKEKRQTVDVGTELLPDPERETYNPAERNLYSTLYVQTAAEYRALCLQTYRLAFDTLQRRAASEKQDKSFAIILDLDETVLDNSRYQSATFKADMTFDPKTWNVWEKLHGDEVTLVPGAQEFLEKVEKMDKPAVTPFFVSNRQDQNRAATLRVLERLKVSTKSDLEKRLLLRTNGPDKDPRRKEVEKTHRVLMWIGDSLADFSSEFDPAAMLKDKNTVPQQGKAILARQELVDKNKDRLGNDWFILPNPMYGDWTVPLGDDPTRHLRETKYRPAQ